MDTPFRIETERDAALRATEVCVSLGDGHFVIHVITDAALYGAGDRAMVVAEVLRELADKLDTEARSIDQPTR